ncbi:hypothetical protein KM043_017605 [Ampulex compressa]|nr:hypothetical protein KM043_017605 [Ampulex compressa]
MLNLKLFYSYVIRDALIAAINLLSYKLRTAMEETTFPPSPNWYCSRILACSHDGIIAYGSRHCMVVARLKSDGSGLTYSIISNAHKERVTSVAFRPPFEEVNSVLLASGGDDGSVNIWKLDDYSKTYSYSFGKDKQVAGVDWSLKDPHVIFCASIDGSLVSWNIQFNMTSSFSLGKTTITCLSCCPHDADLVAVGCKSGLIYIVDLRKKGTVVYKLRGHDLEIVSLSWCPSEVNVLKGEGRDLLLASGGKDRSIFIWRAGGDGRYETQILVPAVPVSSGQHRSKLNASAGSWTVVHWMESKLLLGSSSWGELLSWDLTSNTTKGKYPCKLIHAQHGRGLFSIAHVHESLEQRENSHSRSRVWSLAQDRRLICCLLEKHGSRIEHNISTQGGYVYCIAPCPLDTTRVAFGVGDAMLRLWHLSDMKDTSCNITMLWQKIKGKITAIAWHPDKENLLAYSTDEGRVGVFDTYGKKPPILYRQYHRRTVYTLSWGPSTLTKEYALYSCGEGELVYYDTDKPNEQPILVMKLCTAFSWKSDFSCMAVGLENGSIAFFDRNLTKCGHDIHVQKKITYCMVWHPESTATDLAYSPYRNYLAVAFNSPTISILDVSELTERTSADKEPSNVYKIVANLVGHLERVVCLAWSPHFSGHLVSGSYDNTVQVWKVGTQELIATYTGHCAPVLCCMWSPLHASYLITGSSDFTVRLWSHENLPAIMPDFTKNSNSKKSKRKSQNCKAQDGNEKSLSSFDGMSQEIAVIETGTAGLKVSTKQKKKKSENTSLFSKQFKEMRDTNVILDSIRWALMNTEDKEDNSREKELKSTILFAGKNRFEELIAEEKCVQVGESDYNAATEMDLWRDNLKESLDEAAREKRLNDFLVSLAPSLSMKTWKEMCEAYANQLVLEHNPRKAVSYLLCVHKIYEAIRVFTDACMYKEAFVLARCRLDSDDPAVKELLLDWLQHDIDTGHFEPAAHVYMYLKDPANAAKYLALRNSTATLTVAAEVAFSCGEDLLGTTSAYQAITNALKNSKYETARDLILKFPRFKYREVQIRAHEELRKIVEEKTTPEVMETWLSGQSSYGFLQILKKSLEDCDTYYDKLQKNYFVDGLENETKLWLNVSQQLAMAALADNKEKELKHVALALGAVYQFEVTRQRQCEKQKNLLLNVITNLESKSPYDSESIFTSFDPPVSVSKSLRAYLCLALLNWMVNEDTSIDGLTVTIGELIEDLLEDALDQRTARYWSIADEINKTESRIASFLCKSQQDGETEANQDAENKAMYVEKLDRLKNEKESYIQERICAPSPIIIYCKANELIAKMENDTTKDRLANLVAKTWTKALL